MGLRSRVGGDWRHVRRKWALRTPEVGGDTQNIYNHWPNPASVPTVTLQLLGYGEVCGVLGEDQGNDGQVTVGLGGGLRGAAVYLPGWKCFGVSTILGAVSSMYTREALPSPWVGQWPRDVSPAYRHYDWTPQLHAVCRRTQS